MAEAKADPPPRCSGSDSRAQSDAELRAMHTGKSGFDGRATDYEDLLSHAPAELLLRIKTEVDSLLTELHEAAAQSLWDRYTAVMPEAPPLTAGAYLLMYAWLAPKGDIESYPFPDTPNLRLQSYEAYLPTEEGILYLSLSGAQESTLIETEAGEWPAFRAGNFHFFFCEAHGSYLSKTTAAQAEAEAEALADAVIATIEERAGSVGQHNGAFDLARTQLVRLLTGD